MMTERSTGCMRQCAREAGCDNSGTIERGRIMSGKNDRANALLIEMLIVVLFFALACTVLVQVWGGAHKLSVRAGDRSSAIAEAQAVAEMLIASGEDTLPETAEGFTEEGDQWVKQVGNTLITVKLNMSETGFGRIREGTVSLTEQGEVLAELDISRYLPKEGAI